MAPGDVLELVGHILSPEDGEAPLLLGKGAVSSSRQPGTRKLSKAAWRTRIALFQAGTCTSLLQEAEPLHQSGGTNPNPQRPGLPPHIGHYAGEVVPPGKAGELVVSTARWHPPHNGRPLAMTSILRSSKQ